VTSVPTILLVEDNDDDAELTRRAFQRSHIANRLVHVSDGAEALDYLFATGSHARAEVAMPALVLLDLKLPKITGLEVLKTMRGDDRTRRVPVVVLTSSDEERDLIATYNLGANSFVRKPVNFAEFVTAAHQLGMYWLLLNRQPNVG
jgi:two-component system response regulator